MTFVLIHGSFSTPHHAWFPWLKEQLEMLGHLVIAPAFPVDKWSDVRLLDPNHYNPIQNLDRWTEVFDSVRPKLHSQSLCFIGHSLGPLFILHLVKRYMIRLQHAFFLAPFFELNEKSALVEKANVTFYKTDFDFRQLRDFIPHSTVIYSLNDPYVEKEKSIKFAQQLKSKTIALSGFGHMGIESGITKFPELLKIINKTNLSL